MTYAIPDDVAVDLRGSAEHTDIEATQWQAWLDRVERQIRRRFKQLGHDLDTQIANGDPEIDDLVDVEVEAVVRKVRSTEAAGQMAPGTSRTLTIDDGSITDRNDGRVDSDYNALDLTEAEWDRLLPAGRRGRARVFSVMPR